MTIIYLLIAIAMSCMVSFSLETFSNRKFYNEKKKHENYYRELLLKRQYLDLMVRLGWSRYRWNRAIFTAGKI